MKKLLNLQSYTSIHIGPQVEVDLLESIEIIQPETFLIGGGNNLLVSQTPPKMAMLSKKFDFLHVDQEGLHIGGATPSGKILSFAKKHDIAGFELMQKLPGTLGGMIKMNAGLKEWEVFNNLLAIKTPSGWIDKSKLEYAYRWTNIKEPIFEARFTCKAGFDQNLLEFFKKLRESQPKLPSAGSCFKNPKNNFAGRLLEEAGLKGFELGNMAFSASHANFLVNLGGGTFEEAITLINLAKKKVKEKSGVDLEEEIIIL